MGLTPAALESNIEFQQKEASEPSLSQEVDKVYGIQPQGSTLSQPQGVSALSSQPTAGGNMQTTLSTPGTAGQYSKKSM